MPHAPAPAVDAVVPRPVKLMVAAVAIITSLAFLPAPVAAGPGSAVRVTTGADDGPGSLRAAVAEASADPSIRRIRIESGLTVRLETPVVYTGDRDLGIIGGGTLLEVGDARWLVKE